MSVASPNLPEGFCLAEFGKVSEKGCVVPREFFEKWLPEQKPAQSFNWIVEEILEDVALEKVSSGNVHESEIYTTPAPVESKGPENATVVREFTMTAVSQEAGESIEISHFLYPIVNEPYTMGQIACASLLSKLFVQGLYSCERMVFMMGICEKWSQSEQEIVEKLTMDGFKQAAATAQIAVNDAEMHVNINCIVGGMITAFRPHRNSNFRNNSVIGDVIVLTKPLGCQIALNAYKCLQQQDMELKERLSRAISEEDLLKAYQGAISLMTTLNYQTVKLAEAHEVHAVTEINGLSLMEHAKLLAEQQLNEVSFYIYNLPIIMKMLTVAKVLGNQSELAQGNVAEISGGLLLVMPREQAATYCRNILNGGSRAWIIGVVEHGNRTANMTKKARVIDWAWKA